MGRAKKLCCMYSLNVEYVMYVVHKIGHENSSTKSRGAAAVAAARSACEFVLTLN